MSSQQPFVESRFQRVGIHLARLADHSQRIFILALPALDLGDVNQRLGVVGIGFGQILVLLQRIVELIVVEQRLRQRIHGLQIAGLQIFRALVSRDRILGLLHLVVQRAQREFHLRRAPIHGNRLNRLHRMLQVAALGVEPRQVQHHIF